MQPRVSPLALPIAVLAVCLSLMAAKVGADAQVPDLAMSGLYIKAIDGGNRVVPGKAATLCVLVGNGSGGPLHNIDISVTSISADLLGGTPHQIFFGPQSAGCVLPDAASILSGSNDPIDQRRLSVLTPSTAVVVMWQVGVPDCIDLDRLLAYEVRAKSTVYNLTSFTLLVDIATDADDTLWASGRRLVGYGDGLVSSGAVPLLSQPIDTNLRTTVSIWSRQTSGAVLPGDIATFEVSVRNISSQPFDGLILGSDVGCILADDQFDITPDSLLLVYQYGNDRDVIPRMRYHSSYNKVLATGDRHWLREGIFLLPPGRPLLPAVTTYLRFKARIRKDLAIETPPSIKFEIIALIPRNSAEDKETAELHHRVTGGKYSVNIDLPTPSAFDRVEWVEIIMAETLALVIFLILSSDLRGYVGLRGTLVAIAFFASGIGGLLISITEGGPVQWYWLVIATASIPASLWFRRKDIWRRVRLYNRQCRRKIQKKYRMP